MHKIKIVFWSLHPKMETPKSTSVFETFWARSCGIYIRVYRASFGAIKLTNCYRGRRRVPKS